MYCGCNLVLEVEFPWSCVMECEAVCIMTLKSGAGNLEKGNKRNVRVSKRCRWITAGKYFEKFGPRAENRRGGVTGTFIADTQYLSPVT